MERVSLETLTKEEIADEVVLRDKEITHLREELGKMRDKLSDHDSAAQAHKENAQFLAGELERAKWNYENACTTIANMHRAAMGTVCGPNIGVVEDVEELRKHRDQLLDTLQRWLHDPTIKAEKDLAACKEELEKRKSTNAGWNAYYALEKEMLSALKDANNRTEQAEYKYLDLTTNQYGHFKALVKKLEQAERERDTLRFKEIAVIETLKGQLSAAKQETAVRDRALELACDAMNEVSYQWRKVDLGVNDFLAQAKREVEGK